MKVYGKRLIKLKKESERAIGIFTKLISDLTKLNSEYISTKLDIENDIIELEDIHSDLDSAINENISLMSNFEDLLK